MIPVSDLLVGTAKSADSDESRPAADRQHPVVVWHVTGANNLDPAYGYETAGPGHGDGELTTAEATDVIDDIAAYGVAAIRFSGGEPLLRDDLETLVERASDTGLRTELSTNGTLLTDERAESLRAAGLDDVDVAIDGLPEHHDDIYGREGAFDDALDGIEAAQHADLDPGVRFTLTEANAADMEELVDLLALQGVSRFRFHHLEYSADDEIMDLDVDHEAQRRAVRRVCDITLDAHDRGHDVETLLEGNRADTGYVYQYAREELDEGRAAAIRERLETEGGDPVAERIADIDYQGNVHLTPYWQAYSLGNVRDRPFSAIWEDESNPLLAKLRDREDHLPDRCPNCEYYAMCRGGSRHRALAAEGDVWARDPQCYLTDDEIGLDVDASAD
ncbi:Heme biosynthesis protein [Halorhabdus tiamatea SARL4B]|uniref:Heme biosynthesis protein n=1 Tax=Halorhabdus tiamatea SARL4B TaxID=1033806 RepID=F7PP52_9EURY|nr:TIGR04347 family pseudo-SAM/SPASM protein [Halorhabdus tiamatea]ERJ07157.1 Heme biosynthesis protein [Halorhabdus tiamatea SARL4B]CCQ32779.1 heme d1 biosynthesis protein NirJ [Halorhabdus tiamatea SARL4B]